MTISYKWLKDYLNFSETPEQIAEILTNIGLEVESIETYETIKGGLVGVALGQVITCENHPDSDHLHITTVNVGSEQPLQIVCGAPNVAAGQKVAVATIGATLYFSSGEEIKIKRSKIRGVESFGMICAEDELGIGNDHSGIMVIDTDAEAGTPINQIFKLENDYIFEIGLTPNRIDAASHHGVARDLAAYMKSNGSNVSLKLPEIENFKTDNTNNVYEIVVENTEACPRYAGITISNIKIAPSPDWLQQRLKSIGINPKNNAIDITNFIINELGQPLHAFDADKIDGKKVVIKTCDEGTIFTTLDGVERKLSDKDLMICSATRPMCIAGVFGGLDSGISDETKNVFLECAYFNPVWIRKTARRHGLHTDASFHYERGTDPNIIPYAISRAALLFKEITKGEISSEINDICSKAFEPFGIELSYKNIDRLIGKKISRDKIKTILESLEIKIINENDDILFVEVPPYRVDVTRECDVIEEILRIYSYNNVDFPSELRSTLSHHPKPDNAEIINIVSDFLSNNGFAEIMSNSLTSIAYYEGIKGFDVKNLVKILNPLSNELNVMRQTLLFNGLETIAHNANRKNNDLKLYEFGNIYSYNPDKADGTLKGYSEEYRLAIFVTGADTQLSWNIKFEKSTFFTLKKTVERLCFRFGINTDELQVSANTNPFSGEGLSYILKNGKTIATIGIIDKNICEKCDVKQDVFVAEIYWEQLMKHLKNHFVLYKELPKFPEVRRDFALIINKNVTYKQLHDIAYVAEKKFLKNVSLFDVYEGKNLPEGKKQYALSFVLQDEDKTLTDMQIEHIMQNLLKAFETKAGATLR
ncbi:MAG: phenylalanine--tRNA ligase subunit beta [Prevotellaceae bacterium]|jgi:phenylalanyl-tRNA synthetase beta chain|nr:phenylalanine--tRNA ligase subunit beta [Prevotellaceae bacterium]